MGPFEEPTQQSIFCAEYQIIVRFSTKKNIMGPFITIRIISCWKYLIERRKVVTETKRQNPARAITDTEFIVLLTGIILETLEFRIQHIFTLESHSMRMMTAERLRTFIITESLSIIVANLCAFLISHDCISSDVIHQWSKCVKSLSFVMLSCWSRRLQFMWAASV